MGKEEVVNLAITVLSGGPPFPTPPLLINCNSPSSKRTAHSESNKRSIKGLENKRIFLIDVKVFKYLLEKVQQMSLMGLLMGILVRFRPDGMFFRELLLEAVGVFDEAAFESVFEVTLGLKDWKIKNWAVPMLNAILNLLFFLFWRVKVSETTKVHSL